MCPHSAIYVLILLCMSSYCYVSSYYLLRMCPHPAMFAWVRQTSNVRLCVRISHHTHTAHLSIGRQSADIVHLKLLALYPRPRQHTSAYISIRQHTSKLQLKLLFLYEGREQRERERERGRGRKGSAGSAGTSHINTHKQRLSWHNQDCWKTHIFVSSILPFRRRWPLLSYFLPARRVHRGWEGAGLDMWRQELVWWGLCTVFGKVLPSPGRMVWTSTPIFVSPASKDFVKKSWSPPLRRASEDGRVASGEIGQHWVWWRGVCLLPHSRARRRR